ncbi:DUF2087 domain-containing protein [Trueperella pyogenes]
MTKRPSWQGFIAAVIGEESSFALAQVILGQARWDSIPGLSQKKSAKTLELLRPYLHSPDGKEIRIDRETLRELLKSADKNNSREDSAIISKFVSNDLRLKKFPSRPTERYLVLEFLAKRLFSPKKDLHESQVNERLKVVTDDFATLRRYLIDANLLTRQADGSSYRSADLA